MGAVSFVQGTGVGAGLMYFFDPDLGHRRRALLRDQVIHLVHQANHGAEASLDDLSHRMEGVAAEARAAVNQRPVDDVVLVERVRSRIGRVNSHPGAIEVTAENGTVTLGGPILANEVERLLAAVAAVSGVHNIVNHLEVHETPGDVPGLQGESHLARTQSFFDAPWDPSARLLAGVAGAGLVGYALGRRDILGWVTGATGASILARALSNQTWQQLFGLQSVRDAVEYQKEISINAPVDQVFQIWANVENFPRFMEHVLQVNAVGPGRSTWTIRGPMGVPIHFEAETTHYQPNEEIAWRSVDGATVANGGRVTFRTNPDGSTRINVHLSYTPPAGVFGNLAAWFFGDDPKQLLDDDLMRLKSLLENGKTTVRHHTIELNQVAPRQIQTPEAMRVSKQENA